MYIYTHMCTYIHTHTHTLLIYTYVYLDFGKFILFYFLKVYFNILQNFKLIFIRKTLKIPIPC